MGILTPEYADPTTEEFRRRRQAAMPETGFGGGFQRGEQETFGALGSARDIGTQQAALAAELRRQASGQGPSIAQMQLAQSLEQQGAATQAQLASARGLSPALAQRLALESRGEAAQQAAAQGALLRTQEQQAARAALANVLQAQRQQELFGGELASGYAGRMAQLEAQREQFGTEAVLGAAAREAEQRAKIATGLLSAAGATGAAAAGKARGGEMNSAVPGKAKFKGDTRSNDTVPALLSPGEIVLPRSVAQDEDAPEKAKKFVEAIKKQKRPNMKNLAQALSRIAELEARLDAMEALKDLESEQDED